MSATLDRVLAVPSRLRPATLAGRLQASVALDARDVDQALQLHWRASRGTPHAASGGCSTNASDALDPQGDYLLVRDRDSGGVVGACRVRQASHMRRAGGLCAGRAFQLDALDAVDGGLIELGRICIEPDRPSVPVIAALWSALARYMAAGQLRHALGCVSVPINDGGHYAASLYRTLARRYLVGAPLRVCPRNRLPIESLLSGCDPVVPPLVRGYLRAGAVLLGEPHVDHDLACAELPMWLDRRHVLLRALRRLSSRAPPPITRRAALDGAVTLLSPWQP